MRTINLASQATYISRGGAMITSSVSNIHATKDGFTRAVGWSCDAGLAAAHRECLGQTERPDQIHQVRVSSGTRHPCHKATMMVLIIQLNSCSRIPDRSNL
eukprot:876293-Pelagomonas_calceolata.AAC.1